ncbi:MAG: hypothetical protein ACE5JL_18435, partial [Dehalococcoidia bacterium]
SNKLTTTTEFHTSLDEWLEFRGGYTFMELEQETFSHSIRDAVDTTRPAENELVRGYLTGRTDYHIATAAVGLLLADWWDVDVHGRWEMRDNRSSIGDSTGWHTLRTIVDPRIDRISTVEGTVETTLRFPPGRTRVSGGWTRKRTNRDLQFTDLVQGALDTHILPGYTLYASNTTQDTFFIVVAAHPAPGWTARGKSSVTTSSDTGLITEPTTAWDVKGVITYYAPVLLGVTVSVHGGIKDFENDDKAFVDVSGAAFPVDHDGTSATAGATASIIPVEGTTLFATYTYLSNDFDTTFYRTDRRRFREPRDLGLNVIFSREQALNYDDQSHSFTGGFTQQLTDWWVFSGSGLFTFSEGENASGPLADILVRPDNDIDHLDYVASASTEVSLGDGWGVAGEYSFEAFEDDIDPSQSGHINTFLASVFMTR